MDEHDVLQHLLKIEAEADTLVEDAQTEVDRRITEGEKENRAHYEKQYGQAVAVLEADYTKEIATIKEEHQKQLDVYQKSLDTIPIHTNEFSKFVSQLLL